MTDQSSTETREVSNVSTQETILANLKSQEAASEPEKKQEETPKPKVTAQERIRQLVDSKNKAEQEADNAKREADELRKRLDAMQATAPVQELDRPTRDKFGTDEDYIEALADWKAKQAIIQREREQAEARVKAEQEELVRNWQKRQEATIKEIPDYVEVVEAADIPIAKHVEQFIIESDVGPEMTYYFALNPDVVRKINAMKPLQAARYLTRLEDELQEPETKVKDEPKPVKSKAPEPIDPVKGSTSADASPSTSFEEYKRRRQAQKGK